MRRRELIAGLCSAAAWPLVARGQQMAMPVIGMLHQGAAEPSKDFIAAFLQGLRQTGYVEGKNVQIKIRWAEGRYDRLQALADDLIVQDVSLIVAAFLPAALAAKSATSTVPIIFISGSDPIETGLVSSLNQPSGNVTGIALGSMLGAKRLELLHQLVPQADFIAVLTNPKNRNAQSHANDVEAAALNLHQKIQAYSISNEDELHNAFSALAQARPGALLVQPDTFLGDQSSRLISWAARQHVPAMYYRREYVTAGGLMSYGVYEKDGFRLAGIYAGQILKNKKPTDLPVMQPTKYEFVINLAAARELNLDVPANLLALADEVIE